MEEQVYPVFNLDGWWWSRGRRALIRALMARYADGVQERKVLEIGCGTGAMIKELEPLAASVCGLDISPAALRYCRQRGIDSVCVADAACLPYQGSRFDLIIGIDVLEHVDDDAAALREIYRVCRPGGLLILTVPAFQFLWSRRDEQNHHKRRYTLSQFRDRVLEAGFIVNRASYINMPLLLPLFLLVKVGHLLRRSPSMKMDFVLVPPPVNALLSAVVEREASWLRRADLPIGTSIMCVALRPADAKADGG